MVHEGVSVRNAGWFVPAALLAGLVLLYPAVRTLWLSLQDLSLRTAFDADFVGLDNYIRLLGDSRFRSALWITTVFTTLSVALEFVIGLALAVAVNGLGRGAGAVRTILLVPWTLPTAVIAVLWAWIFNDQYGILNSLLVRSGIVGAPIPWLGEPAAALTALIIADVWKTTPFVFIILLAGLQSIPRDLYEALEVDGGGRWASFRWITWPLLARFVFVAVVFRAIQAFSMSFDLVYVMTAGGPGGATETLPLYAYQTMMRGLDFGYAAALVMTTVLMLGAVAAGLYLVALRGRQDPL